MNSSDEPSTTSENQQVVFQGLRVQLVPAPLLKRFLAYSIDMGVILAIMYPLFFLGAIGVLFVVGLGELFVNGMGGILGIIGMVLGLLVILSLQNGYFILQEKRSGTTIGKKLFGIRVTSLDGKPLTLGQAVLRDLMRYIDCILIFPGLFSVLLSNRSRRLGDLMAGTVVVYSASREKSHTFMYLSSEEYTQLEQLLQPRVIPSDLAGQFKKFAFQRFIVTGIAHPEVERQWLEALSSYIGDTASGASVPTERTLRFFAERCLQQQYLQP